ncbi:MAG TPA: isoprenylcysteine carboxylmethyltransferase family protein [Microlunatus sp.]|nr:isoprenylcysteine carboxylmethyltransferase family protein [Microlunatus sp.]
MITHRLILGSWLACFGSFLWAGHAFFTSSPITLAPRTRMIKRVGLAVSVAQFLIMTKSRPVGRAADRAGTVMLLAALALFWSSIRVNREQPLSLSFSTDRPDHLITRGPYRLIRHPFYLSYLLAWSAAPVATRRWWVGVGPVIMAVLYRRAARFEEAKFLASPLAECYRDYQRSTGMFLPTIRPPRHPGISSP